MRPLVRAAIAAALLVVVARLAEQALPESSPPLASAASASASALAAPCPAGSLPDQGACIPVPLAKRDAAPSRERGALASGEHIPLGPDRPADYGRYAWPSPLRAGPRAVAPGERFAVVLGANPGAPVRLVRLEHEQGEAEIAFVGELMGKTVMTRHSVRDGAAVREVLVLFAGLGRTAPGLVVGARVPAGTTLGFVAAGDDRGEAELTFAVRRVRDGVASRALAPGELLNDARSVAVDPRNVLAPK